MPTYRQTGKMAVNNPSALSLPNPDILKRLVVAESGFIFDPLLGKSYSANRVGLAILRSLQDGKKLDEIIDGITKEFMVSQEDAERDIIEFINSLQGQMK